MNLDITINQLGEGARELAFQNQKKQGKEINGEARLLNKEESFDFSESNEGPDFWGAIIQGDFFTALELYDGPHILLIVNASNNHATYYLQDETHHFDFSGAKHGDVSEIMKALELKEELKKKGALPIYGTRKKSDMTEEQRKVIESFEKKWNNRKK